MDRKASKNHYVRNRTFHQMYGTHWFLVCYFMTLHGISFAGLLCWRAKCRMCAWKFHIYSYRVQCTYANVCYFTWQSAANVWTSRSKKKKLYWNRRNFVCMWCTMFDGIMRLMLMNAYNMKWKSNSDQKLGVNTHTHTQHPCSHTHSYTYVLHALWTE